MTVGLGHFIRIQRPGVYLHWCPACGIAHQFNISSTDHPEGKRWGWDGDLRQPTVEPELRHQVGAGVCAYVLRAGTLTYLASSTHALAGQAVPLPIFPDVRI
jgi:hypothetical protein